MWMHNPDLLITGDTGHTLLHCCLCTHCTVFAFFMHTLEMQVSPGYSETNEVKLEPHKQTSQLLPNWNIMPYVHRKLEGSAASGDIWSVAPSWWVILRPLTPWHCGLLAKASGRVACKCAGHPLACHCVIRQKIRPNSWDLRTVLPLLIWVMHCDVYTCTSPKITGKKYIFCIFMKKKETKFSICFRIASSRQQPSWCLENAVFSHYYQCKDKA